MEDWDLITKISANNREAFDTLYKKYYRLLVNYIRSYTHDLQQAEDIVQQVFINLWLERQELKISNTVKAYLYWVSYTEYLDIYRKTKRRSDILDELKLSALKDVISEDQFYTELKIKRLKQLIETLPPTSKEVLKLNKFQGLKYSEIAEKLNISVKTVESHMRTAFKHIRKGFKNHGIYFHSFFKCYESLLKKAFN
ncbi:RNA polymerase sigma factor [Aestuariibaculum marinum]|uniref:RNA polymerase sigma-70 factor n=1 Tax=Aestuariibaculum marinum TaxID=2683592 RepID=A0A8J6Q6Z6_9FLAO|nr:RNA polymerase sigma-70 factor [Aestuariibaculum marinum]MBD0825384.1 RNA polymerase sigma-70 factor [Aestuariibaculum marinum]